MISGIQMIVMQNREVNPVQEQQMSEGLQVSWRIKPSWKKTRELVVLDVAVSSKERATNLENDST